jgi:DedD protein
MTKQIITDEESNLKRQARRRLLGAIALTILVVILLPMFMDRDPPVPSRDIDLKIPDKDKAGEFVPKMVLPPLSASEAASQPASAPVIAPLLDVKPVGDISSAKDKAVPVIVPKPASKGVDQPVESKQKINPEPKPTPKSLPKPASKHIAKPHSGFVLQVGAFTNAEAAKKLQEKLHKQGYSSYTEKSGNKIRVRIGDYSSHAEADKVRSKLEIQGMKPDVINLN